MKKFIEKLFNVKILSGKEYKFLLDRIVEMGKTYRDADEYKGYSHGFKTARVLLSDLSTICTIENMFWDDVKDRVLDKKSKINKTIDTDSTCILCHKLIEGKKYSFCKLGPLHKECRFISKQEIIEIDD